MKAGATLCHSFCTGNYGSLLGRFRSQYCVTKGRVVEQNTDPFKRERQRKLSITDKLCSDHETEFGLGGALSVTPHFGRQKLAYA